MAGGTASGTANGPANGAGEAKRLARLRDDAPAPYRLRSTRTPRAIAWYGFSAFWGHLRHLVASAIATENIDSRQWMVPDAPDALLARVCARLGRGPAATLAEALGREVWIDYVSDTGDDVAVSEAVARLVAAPYVAEGPDSAEGPVALPRGDVLFLGGDLAYPVATVREMTRRLVEPWNAVLEAADDGVPRVLLAVPGNHDWYDGLDGFARLCQAPCDFEDEAGDEALRPRPDDFPVLAWAEAFAKGESVEKPPRMRLFGYEPMQRASYFKLALAPGLELCGVDRQLKRVDPRQVAYFGAHAPRARLVVVPDPVRAFGEIQPHGAETVRALGLALGRSPTFLLSGDIHHYERSDEGPSVHVVAGGGGAFLHGARIAGGARYDVRAEFPSGKASARLLWRLPLHVALGGAGWLLVLALGLANALSVLAGVADGVAAALVPAFVTSVLVAVSTALLVGWRKRRAYRVLPFCAALGAGVGAIPVGVAELVDDAFAWALGQGGLARATAVSGAILAATVASAALFGVLLALLGRLGLNHPQAYAALGDRGYKHFVRLRARVRDGRPELDAWVLGLVDPVGAFEPVVVDTFRWRPPS